MTGENVGEGYLGTMLNQGHPFDGHVSVSLRAQHQLLNLCGRPDVERRCHAVLVNLRGFRCRVGLCEQPEAGINYHALQAGQRGFHQNDRK